MIRKALITVLTLGAGATLLLGLLGRGEHLPSAAQRAFLGMPTTFALEYSKHAPQRSYGWAQGFLWFGVTTEVESRTYIKRTRDYRVFAVETFVNRQTPYLEVGDQRFYGGYTILPGLLANNLQWTYVQSTIVRVSLGALFALFALYPALAFIRGPLRRWRRRKRGLCIHCGYNLTGLTEPRCPECGEAI